LHPVHQSIAAAENALIREQIDIDTDIGLHHNTGNLVERDPSPHDIPVPELRIFNLSEKGLVGEFIMGGDLAAGGYEIGVGMAREHGFQRLEQRIDIRPCIVSTAPQNNECVLRDIFSTKYRCVVRFETRHAFVD